MTETRSKFQKLSKNLSSQGFGKHMIIIQTDEGYELHYDKDYLTKEDLKRMFQSGMMAGLSEVPDDTK